MWCWILLRSVHSSAHRGPDRPRPWCHRHLWLMAYVLRLQWHVRWSWAEGDAVIMSPLIAIVVRRSARLCTSRRHDYVLVSLYLICKYHEANSRKNTIVPQKALMGGHKCGCTACRPLEHARASSPGLKHRHTWSWIQHFTAHLHFYNFTPALPGQGRQAQLTW